jgi:SAM-dependent methyltransferase
MKFSSKSILERSSEDFFVFKQFGVCDTCGGCGPFSYSPIINPVLSVQWKLNEQQKKAMSARESMYCAFCGCSYRLRILSRAINYWIVDDCSNSLLQNIEENNFDGYKVAEINSCGVLHEILNNIPELHYSEYGSTDSSIPNEDLQELSYKDSDFDIILTSDVIEHVPDVKKALQETLRVLKPGGAHIMTVPLILGRRSKRRAHIENNGVIINDSEPSFHGSGEADYLVWNEFGDDYIDIVREVGFEAYYLFINNKKKDDLSGIILAIKPDPNVIVKRHFSSTDTIINNIDCKWQTERVSGLINKLEKTEDHVRNIEDMLDGYKNEYGVAIKKIKKQSFEIDKLKKILPYSIYIKIKKLIKL